MLVIVFETVSHTAEAGLELTTLSRMTLVSSSSVSCLLSTGITGVQHHIQFIGGWLGGGAPRSSWDTRQVSNQLSYCPNAWFFGFIVVKWDGASEGWGRAEQR